MYILTLILLITLIIVSVIEYIKNEYSIVDTIFFIVNILAYILIGIYALLP